MLATNTVRSGQRTSCDPAGRGRPTPSEITPRSTMTAAEIGDVLGRLDLDVARRHHVEMTTVIAELAHDAGFDWPWTHDDPTNAQLRALARLTLVAPGAESKRATALRRRIESDPSNVFAFAATDLGVRS